MKDFLSSSQPKVELLHQFLPTLPPVTKTEAEDHGKDDDEPAQLAIQLNIFSCGGVALCVCFVHKIIDATTIGSFLNCWSSIILAKDATRCEGAVITPDYSASSLFPQRDKESLPAFFTSGARRKAEADLESVTKRIVFKATAVEGLRAIAASKHVPKPSRFEAISCFIWKHCMAASSLVRGSQVPSFMFFTADIRRRMVPPLSRHLVGNILATLLTDKCTGGPTELDGLASLLRKALDRFKDKFVTGLQGPELYEVVSQSIQEIYVSIGNANPYVFSSWCNMGLTEVDLGWGKPAWVSFMGGGSRLTNHLTILLDGAKEGLHPSPSSSLAPPPSPPDAEAYSILNLLPAAILALVSILSLQDREVLAYMITRSMKSTNPATVSDEKKKTHKKSGVPYKSLVIEAFEDHLSSGEQPSKKVRGKKGDKSGRSDSVRFADITSPDGKPSATVVSQPENNVNEVAPAEEDARETSEDAEEVAPVKKEVAMAAGGGAAASGHKGLARKVLPDVLGLFNSHQWRLWSPNA
ncbi:hypothetical protein RJ640_007434 [Escallonia rubra]|uniref:Uncharacterized protein n=1 Tax=Escallonia rubra TaxID=112253 RepID=A0AA88UMN7_9ASTE|nr:hypothetical protein RJ640_007434 [Escallonia rubra]